MRDSGELHSKITQATVQTETDALTGPGRPMSFITSGSGLSNNSLENCRHMIYPDRLVADVQAVQERGVFRVILQLPGLGAFWHYCCYSFYSKS